MDHSIRALSLLACSEHTAASGQSAPWKDTRTCVSLQSPLPRSAGSLGTVPPQLLLPNNSRHCQQGPARSFASGPRKKQRLQRTAAMNRRMQKAHQAESGLQPTGEDQDSVMPSETTAASSEVLCDLWSMVVRLARGNRADFPPHSISTERAASPLPPKTRITAASFLQ